MKSMANRRDQPYIWVTWLTKLLVGKNSCEWAAWFRAHYTNFRRAPDDFDSAGWQMNHTALLNEVRDRLQTEGRTVFIEKQNRFVLRGTSATLGGKPDLIALSGDKGVIYDVKTGQPSASDHVQVMTYMYAVPRALGQYRNMAFDGVVAYQDYEVTIPASAVNKEFIDRLATLIRRISRAQPLEKTPSAMECGFCQISKEECPERVDSEPDEGLVTTDF